MIGTTRRGGVAAFLTHLGTHASATDLGELASRSGYGRRTLQRWLHQLGERVTFYPSVRYSALGLVHLHAFIEHPDQRHLAFPYAGDAAWVAQTPGEHGLYLHCLVPSTQLASVKESLKRLAPCVTIMTGDGWQDNDLTALDQHGTPQPRTVTAPLRQLPVAGPVLLARAYPLVVPVATEVLARRRTMHDVWVGLYERIGEQIWTFLPARTRRWRRNGEAYVRQAFNLLNRYGLIEQHVVRLNQEQTIELFLTARCLEGIEPLRAHAPLLEYFAGEDIVLVRVQGGISLLKAMLQCDGLLSWWFVRPESVRPPRVRVERFFEPTSGTWISRADRGRADSQPQT